MENKPKVTEDTDEDGIPLSDPKACTSTKEAMDKCFYKWYSEKFLQKIKEPIPCQAEEANYNKCLKRKLKALNLEKVIQDGEPPK